MFLVYFLMAVLLIFSKETGAFIVAVAFLALAASFLQRQERPAWIRESALFFAASVLALILFVWINNTWLTDLARTHRAENAGGRYLNYAVAKSLVLSNAQGYFLWTKDTVLCALIFAVWGVVGLFRGFGRRWDARQFLLFLLGSAGCFYLAGLLLWRYMLLYYMLPVAAFLAIAVAAIAFTPGSRLRPVLVALVLGGATLTAASRWHTGWAILAQDRAKDDIVHALEKQIPSHARAAVALFDVNAAEVARSLIFYLTVDGYEAADGKGPLENDDGEPLTPKPNKGAIRVYGLMEGPWVDYTDEHRYDGSAAEPPTTDEIDLARDLHTPYVIWQYAPRPVLHRVWWMDTLQPGDLIALPVGSPGNSRLQARGLGAFSVPREFYLDTRLRGVKTRVVEEDRIKLPFSNDFLGWDLLEVTAVDASGVGLAGLDRTQSADSAHFHLGKGWSRIDWTQLGAAGNDAFRWGFNGAQIFDGNAGHKIVLDLEQNGALANGPLKIRAMDANGRELASWPVAGRSKYEFNAPAGAEIRLMAPDELKVSPDTICFRLFGIREE